jgi:hypothetical protein
MNFAVKAMSRSLESTLEFIRQQIEQNSSARTLSDPRPIGSTVALERLTSDVKLCVRVAVEFEDDDPIPGNHSCEVRISGCDGPIRCRLTRRNVERPNGDLWQVTYDVAEEDR